MARDWSGLIGLDTDPKIDADVPNVQLTDLPAYDPKGPGSPETLGGTSVVLEMYFFRRCTLSVWIALAAVVILLVYKIAVIGW